jgi:FkbM family methyltransferase
MINYYKIILNIIYHIDNILQRYQMSLFRRRSFSLSQLDIKLEKYLDFKNGFFIEVGANDGISQSNTLYYERSAGWKGLLIEAIPDLAEKCRKNRPKCIVENCALVGFDYPYDTIEMNYCNLMSCTQGAFDEDEEMLNHIEKGKQFLSATETPYKIQVPARTLSAVLDSHTINHIDLLSLDVEGFEVEVLKGIDLNRHSPKYLLIEVRHNVKDAIEAIIGGKYVSLDILSTNESYSDILYCLRDSFNIANSKHRYINTR